MRLQFKHQKFQADAARAVVDVFAGQPYMTPSYMIDSGSGKYAALLPADQEFTGWGNHRIVPRNWIIIASWNRSKIYRERIRFVRPTSWKGAIT